MWILLNGASVMVKIKHVTSNGVFGDLARCFTRNITLLAELQARRLCKIFFCPTQWVDWHRDQTCAHRGFGQLQRKIGVLYQQEMKSFYTKKFFKAFERGSQRSAEEIVPLVLELLQPRSVIDVGCGVGAWLKAFKQHGVQEVLGVDGSYVDEKMLQISAHEFLPCDLRKPLQLNKKFDLVLSLEVAEHLPPECAETFVASLVGLGPIILFSAAIPFQGGTNHLNAQWPDYWMQKFQSRDYVPIDCLRKRIWQNEKVEWWYAQNLLFYVEQRYLAEHHRLLQEFERTCPSQLSIAHPHLVDPKYMSPGKLLEALPVAMWQGVKRRLAKFSHG